MCKTVVLSQKGNTNISICARCKTFYIWQQSYIMTLNESDYLDFMRHVDKQDANGSFSCFPDGEMRLMLNTPAPDIYFTFNEEEWGDFKSALLESHYMSQVYALWQS